MAPNWYLDMTEIIKYWDGQQRVYHHTAPINMMYALYQSLFDLLEEGVDNAINRHYEAHQALGNGLKDLGLDFLVDKTVSLPIGFLIGTTFTIGLISGGLTSFGKPNACKL